MDTGGTKTAKSLDRIRAGILLDVYGTLLTDHQQEVWQLYYLDDWSLAEIGQSQNVSRAAVHDLLVRTEKVLEDYETRLELLVAHERRRGRFRELEQVLSDGDISRAKTILIRWADEEGLMDV